MQYDLLYILIGRMGFYICETSYTTVARASNLIPLPYKSDWY